MSSSGGIPGFPSYAPVVLFLRDPREKAWGLLLAIETAGVALRGLELGMVEEFMRQEARGDERLLGPTTLFYPMHRVERLERDETVGPLESLAARFERHTGRALAEVFDLGPRD